MCAVALREGRWSPINLRVTSGALFKHDTVFIKKLFGEAALSVA